MPYPPPARRNEGGQHPFAPDAARFVVVAEALTAEDREAARLIVLDHDPSADDGNSHE